MFKDYSKPVLKVIIFLTVLNQSGAFLLYHSFIDKMHYNVKTVNNFQSNHQTSDGGFFSLNANGGVSSGYGYDSPPSPDEQFDFIIVGAGPAGCVLANRLSEVPHWNILLIEAGNEENILIDIPIFAAYGQATAYNWNYIAERQNGSCLGMDNQQCSFPRGKGLGGSSIINYMIYNRGNRRDFDRWAGAGNPGWSYNEVLPYFLKSERSRLKKKINPQYHNQLGLLSVEHVPYRTPYVHAFVAANKHLGVPEVDYNGETQMGVSYVQATTLDGKRHTAAAAYLKPIYRRRPNLKILINARVTKILIDPTTKVAYGVDYAQNKKRYSARASKEVLLSAGAFNSPQLLMLSGIGPSEELARINVPLLQDLQVGQNLYDHVCFPGPTFITNTSGFSLSSQRAVEIPVMKQYFLQGKGPLTLIGGVEALRFMKTSTSQDPPDYPDLELIFIPGSLNADEGSGVKFGMRLSDEVFNTVYKPLDPLGWDTWTSFIMLFHPKSVGYMELKDNNPFHWPRFYHNYFKNPEDVDTILEGIREVLRIAETPQFRKIGTRLHDIPLPNCQHILFNSDDYWRCAIRTLTSSLHHQIGTCKMGPRNDPTAVVSAKLKVYGIKRLRVVDPSVVPIPPTGHTNAMSFMIGEKAADMIKARWLKNI